MHFYRMPLSLRRRPARYHLARRNAEASIHVMLFNWCFARFLICDLIREAEKAAPIWSSLVVPSARPGSGGWLGDQRFSPRSARRSRISAEVFHSLMIFFWSVF